MISDIFITRIVTSIRNKTSLSELLTMDILSLIINSTQERQDDIPVYVMPLELQLIWISMFAVIALVGTIGNVTVIWIVLAHRSMRTVPNVFIVNLALADALLSLFNVTISSYGEIFLNWPFGAFYCKFNEGIASASVSVSVMTLAVLSIERYNAIITPLKPRMKRLTAIKIIGLIWCVSLVIITPQWYFVEIMDVQHKNESVTFCVSVWSEISFGELLRSIYSTIFMILTYFLPLGCMSFTYGRVALHLWGAESIGEKTDLQLKQKQAKQKVVKMMIVVVIMFAICWLPMHLYFIFMSSQLTSSAFVNNFVLGMFWLAMSNSMYNPIIYCWMNDKFRDGFKEAFQCCLCKMRGTNTNQTETKV